MQHHELQVFSLSEIASRLKAIMRQPASPSNPPIAAIARHLGIHRDTLYAVASGEKMGRHLQMLVSRFLRQLEGGELEGKQGDLGRWSIVRVENPLPRLILRVDVTGKAGPVLTVRRYQAAERLPEFKKLLGRG